MLVFVSAYARIRCNASAIKCEHHGGLAVYVTLEWSSYSPDYASCCYSISEMD